MGTRAAGLPQWLLLWSSKSSLPGRRWLIRTMYRAIAQDGGEILAVKVLRKRFPLMKSKVNFSFERVV